MWQKGNAPRCSSRSSLRRTANLLQYWRIMASRDHTPGGKQVNVACTNTATKVKPSYRSSFHSKMFCQGHLVRSGFKTTISVLACISAITTHQSHGREDEWTLARSFSAGSGHIYPLHTQNILHRISKGRPSPASCARDNILGAQKCTDLRNLRDQFPAALSILSSGLMLFQASLRKATSEKGDNKRALAQKSRQSANVLRRRPQFRSKADSNHRVSLIYHRVAEDTTLDACFSGLCQPPGGVHSAPRAWDKSSLEGNLSAAAVIPNQRNSISSRCSLLELKPNEQSSAPERSGSHGGPPGEIAPGLWDHGNVADNVEEYSVNSQRETSVCVPLTALIRNPTAFYSYVTAEDAVTGPVHAERPYTSGTNTAVIVPGIQVRSLAADGNSATTPETTAESQRSTQDRMARYVSSRDARDVRSLEVNDAEIVGQLNVPFAPWGPLITTPESPSEGAASQDSILASIRRHAMAIFGPEGALGGQDTFARFSMQPETVTGAPKSATRSEKKTPVRTDWNLEQSPSSQHQYPLSKPWDSSAAIVGDSAAWDKPNAFGPISRPRRDLIPPNEDPPTSETRTRSLVSNCTAAVPPDTPQQTRSLVDAWTSSRAASDDQNHYSNTPRSSASFALWEPLIDTHGALFYDTASGGTISAPTRASSWEISPPQSTVQSWARRDVLSDDESESATSQRVAPLFAFCEDPTDTGRVSPSCSSFGFGQPRFQDTRSGVKNPTSSTGAWNVRVVESDVRHESEVPLSAAKLSSEFSPLYPPFAAWDAPRAKDNSLGCDLSASTSPARTPSPPWYPTYPAETSLTPEFHGMYHVSSWNPANIADASLQSQSTMRPRFSGSVVLDGEGDSSGSRRSKVSFTPCGARCAGTSRDVGSNEDPRTSPALPFVRSVPTAEGRNRSFSRVESRSLPFNARNSFGSAEDSSSFERRVRCNGAFESFTATSSPASASHRTSQAPTNTTVDLLNESEHIGSPYPVPYSPVAQVREALATSPLFAPLPPGIWESSLSDMPVRTPLDPVGYPARTRWTSPENFAHRRKRNCALISVLPSSPSIYGEQGTSTDGNEEYDSHKDKVDQSARRSQPSSSSQNLLLRAHQEIAPGCVPAPRTHATPAPSENADRPITSRSNRSRDFTYQVETQSVSLRPEDESSVLSTRNRPHTLEIDPPLPSTFLRPFASVAASCAIPRRPDPQRGGMPKSRYGSSAPGAPFDDRSQTGRQRNHKGLEVCSDQHHPGSGKLQKPLRGAAMGDQCLSGSMLPRSSPKARSFPRGHQSQSKHEVRQEVAVGFTANFNEQEGTQQKSEAFNERSKLLSPKEKRAAAVLRKSEKKLERHRRAQNCGPSKSSENGSNHRTRRRASLSNNSTHEQKNADSSFIVDSGARPPIETAAQISQEGLSCGSEAKDIMTSNSHVQDKISKQTLAPKCKSAQLKDKSTKAVLDRGMAGEKRESAGLKSLFAPRNSECSSRKNALISKATVGRHKKIVSKRTQRGTARSSLELFYAYLIRFAALFVALGLLTANMKQ